MRGGSCRKESQGILNENLLLLHLVLLQKRRGEAHSIARFGEMPETWFGEYLDLPEKPKMKIFNGMSSNLDLFFRLFSPDLIRNARRGMFSESLRNEIKIEFAFPSTGGEEIRILSRESGVSPINSERFARGTTTTAISTSSPTRERNEKDMGHALRPYDHRL